MPYIGRDLNRGNYLKLDDISSSFNGSTQTFNLTVGGSAFRPGSAFSILVSVGGVIQEPESAYQINNSEITFANAPTAQDGFFCLALAVPIGIGVPGNGTVNGTQMAKPFNYDGFFYLDDANNRVGIGSLQPKQELDVIGNANISGILTASSFSGGSGGINAGVVTCTGLDVNGNGDISGNLVLGGDLTVNGTTTTLDTNLIGVDRIEVGANSSTVVGVAITQSGTADILRLYDGTSQVVTVDDEGKVGIGSAIPGALLNLASANPLIRLTDTDSNVHSTIGGEGGNLYLYTNSSSRDFIFRGSAEVARITGDGKLGIGTHTPTASFQINHASPKIILEDDDNGADVSIANIGGAAVYSSNSDAIFQTSDTTEMFRIASNGNVYFAGTQSGNNRGILYNASGYFGMYASSSSGVSRELRFFRNSSAGSEVMRLVSTGISLHSANGGGVIYGDDGATGVLKLQSTSANNNHARIDIGVNESDNGGVHFYTAGSSVAERRITIKGTTGRVGIGTDSPDTLVEIGNAIGTGTANLLKLTSYTNSQSSRPGIAFWNNNPNTAQAQISAKGGASYNASKLHFSVANSSRVLADRACIDEFGTFIIGPGETRRNTKGSNQHQVLLIEGTGNNSTRMSMIRSSNDDNGPEIQLIKTRGTSIGSVTKPNQNDFIGSLTFIGADDSDLYARGAEIAVQATGTPANDRIPSDIIFSTTPTSGATSPQEAVRITSEGRMGIDTNNPFAKLSIGDSSNDGAVSQLLKLGNNSSGAGTGAGIQLGAGSGNAGNAVLLSGFYDGTGTSFTIETCNTFGGSQSEKFRITNVGRVGINSTSPEFEMDVLPPSGVTNTTICVKGRGSGYAQFRLEGEGGATENYLTSTTVPLAIYVGTGGQKAKLDTNGMFLIGAGGADQHLHIKQSTTTTYAKIENTGTSSNYTGINLKTPTLNFQIWNQGPGASGAGYGGANSVNFWQAAATGPYTFYHGNNERLRIAADGNIGVNCTPVSIFSAYKSIQLNNYGIWQADDGGASFLSNNAYVNTSGNWTYMANDHASDIGMDDGNFYFRNAGSGTGTISWNTPMKIQSDNRINIGEGNSGTALGALHINTSNVMGTETALWVGDNSANRYMTIQQNGSTEQFSHMILRFDDNGTRNVLQLVNRYATGTGYGTQIQFKGNNDEQTGSIKCQNVTSGSSNADMSFTVNNSDKEVLRLQSNGDARFYNALTVARVDNEYSGFTRSGLVLSTPVFNEYHFTWSGQQSYTIDFTCGSYFHSEFTYVQHQTNGGHHMHHYVRGKWANNHYAHTGFIYEHSGNGGALSVSFTVSDQSGGGSVDMKGGLTEAGSPGASYRARYGGGHEGSSTNNTGRFRISETMASGSVGSRGVVLKIYYGSLSGASIS